MLISKFETENTEFRINELEGKYGISLPFEYRAFLLKYNGGLTPETTFKIRKVSSDIRAFYGLGSVEYNLNLMDLDDWIHRHLFPIACDSFGNFVVLGLHGDAAEKVYFEDHETGEVQLIADDLKSFIKSCKSKKISPDVRMSIEEREADLISRGRGHVIDDELREMWQQEIDRYGNIHQERVLIK